MRHLCLLLAVALLIWAVIFCRVVFDIRFCRRKPRRRLKSGRLQFWVEGEPMESAVLKSGQTVPFTVDFKGAGGEAESPATPPTATSSAPDVASVSMAADGMSGVVAFVKPGAAVITVVAEGTATPGEDTITLEGTVTCQGQIASGELVFGAPTP